MLRYLTAGESHGKALVVIVEGLPAGLPVTVEQIGAELARRRLGFGRGPRMRFEADEIELLAGVRHGRTLGSPVAVQIANTEWPKWEQEMSPHPGRPQKVLSAPRPGHADLAGMQKYGFSDARDVLERASARETAARVAAGCLAKAVLARLGVAVISHVVALGGEEAPAATRPRPEDLDQVDASAVRCFDPDSEQRMVAAVKAAAKAGDSLGGVVEVLAYGVPVGLGSHVHWDRRLDGLLAQALMSIQAVKHVDVGEGAALTARRGSEAHDPISWDEAEQRYRRHTTRAGGIEGGMSTGELVVARVGMKPLATLNRPVLGTVDVSTKEHTVSFKERTDVTAVPAMGVVAETMTALVLAAEALRKFGGDSMSEFERNYHSYTASVLDAPSAAPTPVAERLVLVGMMGSGKSTVGALAARRLGWRFVDVDEEITRQSASTVTELFAGRGEAGFREIESRCLRQSLEDGTPAVVAAGGGAVLSAANRAMMREAGPVVWLRARPETLATRVGDGSGRPLLAAVPAAPAETLSSLAGQRGPMYQEVADVVIDVDDLGPEAVAEQACAAATGGTS